jgi:hypothetical protein
MRLPLALLVAVASLAACTTKYDLSGADWQKPGAMIQTVTFDEMECVRVARDAGDTYEMWVGGLVDVGRMVVEERLRAAAFRRCMLERGYQPADTAS